MISDRDCPGIDDDLRLAALGRQLVAHRVSRGLELQRLARRAVRRRIRRWWRYERQFLQEIGYLDLGEAGA